MKRLLLSASLAASAMLPSAAHAQAIPGAVVAVVDLDRVTRDCNACKTASAALRGQVTSLQSRENTLAAPLQTEGKSLQTAIDALAGKEPDAALQARIKAFQAKQQQYVQKQIAEKLGPIYTQVMQRRGANIMVEIGTTLASASGIDVTTDVLTALNTAMPSLQTTAPAPARPAQQPQGR
jgi:Skp family chaperone for outer membrane proteins